MDALDDPFSEGPVPESIEDESFDQFLQGLAEEDVLEGNLFADEPDPSVPIPLPPAAHDGSLEPPVYDIERLGIPLPVEEKQLPSAGVSGAARTKAPNRRTPQTANDRLEKLRAKNRRGQAKYREKCKVSWSHMSLPRSARPGLEHSLPAIVMVHSFLWRSVWTSSTVHNCKESHY